MRTKRILHKPRQQKFAFAKEDTWERLDEHVRAACQEQIVQVLKEIIAKEREERRRADERKDSV